MSKYEEHFLGEEQRSHLQEYMGRAGEAVHDLIYRTYEENNIARGKLTAAIFYWEKRREFMMDSIKKWRGGSENLRIFMERLEEANEKIAAIGILLSELEILEEDE